jgi:hypothetical protein
MIAIFALLRLPRGRIRSKAGPNKESRGNLMSDEARNNLVRLHPVQDAPADEGVASVIEVLQDHLKLAREGKLRSVAVVSVSEDGARIATQWSCAHGDTATLIGKLTVLAHDMMAARR